MLICFNPSVPFRIVRFEHNFTRDLGRFDSFPSQTTYLLSEVGSNIILFCPGISYPLLSFSSFALLSIRVSVKSAFYSLCRSFSCLSDVDMKHLFDIQGSVNNRITKQCPQ